MKKLIIAVFLALLALFVCVSALAAETLVIAHDADFSVELTGWEITMSDEGATLRVYPVIENRTRQMLNFRLEDVYFDGVEVKGYGAYDVEPGVLRDDFFMFKDADGGKGEALLYPRQISFLLEVKDAESYDLVAEIPVSFTGDELHALYHGDTRADNIPASAQEPEEDPALGVFEPYMEDDTLVLLANEYLCLRLSGWEANIRDDGVTARIYPVIENRTARTLDFRLEEVYFDQTPVKGYGVYDVEPGVCADDFFMFKEPNGKTISSMMDPDQIRFRLTVKDAGNSSMVLTEAYMTISGEWLDMLYEGDPRDMNADYAYDSGDDDDYDDSDYASYTAGQDPCPLEIFDGAYIEWENLSDDRLKIRVQVKNTSWNLSVKSFRVNMYADDLWGDNLWGEEYVYYEETDAYIGPGQTGYSDFFYVPDGDEIGTVYFGISDVYCTNGQEYHISDVEYWYWSLED